MLIYYISYFINYQFIYYTNNSIIVYMKYDYIVWDFNGTILDDRQLCLDILNKMLAERNLKTVTLEEYINVFRFPIIDYYRAVGFDFEKEPFSELGKEFIDLYQKQSFKCGFCVDSIETIIELKKTGVELILLSASKKENLDEQLEELHIKYLFDHVYGIGNIYAESKVHIAERFRNRVGYDKKVLMIGDSVHDFEVATAIKADCILVAQGHQAKHKLLEVTTNVVDTAKEILEKIK